MDIIHGELTKKTFRMLLKLGHKTLHRDMEQMGEDLALNQNPVIKNLNTLLNITAGHLKDAGVKWQKDVLLGYGRAFLWLITKDTAYRDMFFWALDKLLSQATELRKILKPYVKEPKDWTPNQWAFSMNKTQKLRKNKEIPINAKSMEETMFTPPIQDERHKKILKKK